MKASGGRLKVVLFLLGGLLVGVVLGLAVLGGIPGAGGARAGRQPPSVGLPVPDFSLPSLDGETVRLSDLRGRPVVINFWATWCEPCKAEMPLFQSYAQKHGDQVVWLGLNQGEEAGTVRAFAEEWGITFPILLDEEGRAARDYYARSFPVTFFVDAEGVLQAQHIGQVDEALLARYLETVDGRP